MSETLSNIGEVGALFSGIQAPVVLGTVSFTGIEAPERISFGGQQQMTVHKLPGGARVYDLMGPDDSDLDFSGIITGSNAPSKARSIDAMRTAGTPVPLTWPGFHKLVIIRDFRCDYERGGFWLPFRVSCSVVPQQPDQQKQTFVEKLGADVKDALDTSGLSDAFQVAHDALSAVQAVLPVAGVFFAGSPEFQKVAGAVAGAQTATSAGLAAADGDMRGLVQGTLATGTTFGGADAATAVAFLSAAGGASQALAGNALMNGYTSRMGTNLNQVSA
jgi:hypothetical protein